MSAKTRKKRIPKLSYTESQGIGYHVNYRDPKTGQPSRHKFGKISQADANTLYYEWLSKHLTGQSPQPTKRLTRALAEKKVPKAVKADFVPGSLLDLTSKFVTYEESRIREDHGPRTKNTITRKQFNSRKQWAEEFITFLNSRYGKGSTARMMLTDLKMEDVEGFNLFLVEDGYSDSQVRKRMQVVKAIIDRAGRPENGQQILSWNWDSRDVRHGVPDQPIKIPTLLQLKAVLRKCNTQRTAMVWLAIGCGFGNSDLANLRVGQIDEGSYDLRRGKTGKDRYGCTPTLVWQCVQAYLKETPREEGELMFLTRRGMPLVHGSIDSIEQWWSKLRKSLNAIGEELNGFYSLRHLGATEFGSRPACSLSEMRAWLGHSTSSVVADRYMKPLSPEIRPVVEWVRKALQTGQVDLQ